MKLPPLIPLLALALIVVPTVSKAVETTIFSNMGSPAQFYPSGFGIYGSDVLVIPASQIGTLFTPTETFQLTSVRLCLSALDTLNPSVNVHLLTGTADLPLTLIDSVNFHDLNPTGGGFIPEMYTVDFLSRPTFAAGIPLWVVLTGDVGVIAWGANGTDTQGLFKTYYSTDLTSWDAGAVGLQPGFEIIGEVASNVPDSASTVPLLGVALATLVFVSNRTRQNRISATGVRS